MTSSFLIAYGSHTGQSESISKQIKEKCEILGLMPRVFVLEDNEKKFHIEKEELAVIVVSSTGDGDPPENAARFLRRICRKSLPENFLCDLSYALLGLGDSNYSTFQGVPRKLDKQLEHLGATKIIPTAEADDQIGLELAVEPWIDQLLVELCKRFDIPVDKLSLLASSRIDIKEIPKEEKKMEEQNGSTESKENKNNEEEIQLLQAEPFDYPGDTSLIKGSESLSKDESLRVPIAPISYLSSSVSHEKIDTTTIPWQNNAKMVGIHSSPCEVTVVGTALVTSQNAQKPKRELVLDLGEHWEKMKYEPGDAFYFTQTNPEKEVNFILKRMGLLDVADQKCTVGIASDTKKPNASVPAYIPPVCTLRYIFTNCVDIRRAPGRPILRIFAESTSDEGERRRLLELCSAQGMNEFTSHVRQANVSISDVLFAFPGVKPSADRLMEQLPRLIPRPYSVSNCYERGRGRVRFVYSQVSFDVSEGRRYHRLGLATEWLNHLRVGDKISIMFKEPARFRFPPSPLSWNDALSMPLLMIGPGTGVSTFLSFMHKLLDHKLTTGPLPFAERFMYFGCRDFGKDYIYRDELEAYVREGVLTELIVCESQPIQDETPKREKYVQEALKNRAPEVMSFLSLAHSRVFVCGDAHGMSKDVWQCFVDIVMEQTGKSDMEARAYLLDLKKQDRFIEDVWS